MIRLHLTAVLLGCFLDLCFGDPDWLWHPVCAIGSLINWLEKKLRNRFSKDRKGEQSSGLILVILVLLTTGGLSLGILMIAYMASPYVGLLMESLLCYQMMAWHSLKKESMKVYYAFQRQDLEGARYAVSMIVGRDTKELTDVGITKAAVETIAENTSDGIIAPFLFMVCFGGVGGALYKAVNTMDSMIGYQNERYLWFGRAAAKLDDIINYLPARISAGLMIGAGYICQFFHSLYEKKENPYSGSCGLRIFLRDRFNHKSPNSAQTEAVCAGVLQVELAGNARYFGTLYEKPTIGDPIRSIEYEDIRRANVLMSVTYLLALLPVVLLVVLL
ncbi:adenosylcobinamide-phosphate synthase CbiB [Clostridium sp. E02]|uniref:adenosylcobinamide-phosphate synthase CbiB n=1 Tax=Clostridium sp. E02 TaxID=2487134 RepID=UPI000F538611|nr:adenosylcobinamide-phosphate synthase CbiB [Clostridium sp. E02]